MPPTRENRLLARAVIASQFAPPFMFSAVSIALPAIGSDLHAGATSLSLVETLFLAGSLSFLLPAGRLADAGDKRRLYKLGLLGFSITSMLIGLTSWMPILLFLRFLQGASSAVFAATGPAILADIVPVQRRGRAFGASLGAIYAGLSLGPIVAGWLVEHISWRAVFFFGAVTLMGGFLFIRSMMASTWDIPLRVLNKRSMGLLVAMALSLAMGSSLLNEGVLGYALIALGLSFAVLFIHVQRRLNRPLVNVTAVMANRVLRGALMIQTLVYFQAMASVFLLNYYMQVSLDVPADSTGTVVAVGSVIMAVLAPFSGRLADRFSPRLLSSVGVASIAVTGLMATMVGEGTSLWYIRMMFVFQGFGFALFSSPNMTIIMNSVSENKTSMASALSAKSRSIGVFTGMLIASILISLQIGADKIQDHPEAMITIVTTTFAILFSAQIIALVISIFGGRAAPAAQPSPNA